MSGRGDNDLPVVDFTASHADDPDTRNRLGRTLVAAFAKYGFVYLTGHGVPQESIDGVFAAGRDLFHAPDHIRNAVHYGLSRMYRGFVPLNDPLSPSVHKQSYDCGFELPDSYQGPGATLGTSPNLWPDIPGFRVSLEDYFGHVRRLADDILGMIAVGLGWPRDYFLTRSDKPIAQLRLLRYLPDDTSSDAKRYSAGTHSDYEALTILAQDSVGGLQARLPDGTFMDVSPLPGAFVLNVGEMLTMWTNGLMPATPHRVLTPRERQRYSVAFFYGTNYDTVIEPRVASGQADDLAYEPVVSGDYLERRLAEVGG